MILLMPFFFGVLFSSLIWILFFWGKKRIHFAEKQILHNSISALEEKIKNQKEMTDLLEKNFFSISQKTLESNHSLFMKMAEGSLEKVLIKAEGKWDQKEDKVNHMMTPIKEMLNRLEKQRQQMDSNHQKNYGSLEEQLRSLMSSNANLRKETENLVTVLRKPHVRGKWGELTLRRVVEISGMQKHCDFFEQESTSDGAFRPDMIVRLPENRQIIIDAKVPLQGYLEILDAQTEEDKKNCLVKHTRQVLEHIDKLSCKTYWKQFKNTPEFVVMFMPGESFFSTAIEFEKNLIEKGLQKKVIIATPTTLIALLRTVSYGWQQNKLAHNAEKISVLGTQLYERVSSFLSHYEKLGKSLNTANQTFNQSLSVLESRILVSARKLKDLGVSSLKSMDTPNSIDLISREPLKSSSPETIDSSVETDPISNESSNDVDSVHHNV